MAGGPDRRVDSRVFRSVRAEPTGVIPASLQRNREMATIGLDLPMELLR